MTTPSPPADDAVGESRRPAAEGAATGDVAEEPQHAPGQFGETAVGPAHRQTTDPSPLVALPISIPESANAPDNADLPGEPARAEQNGPEADDPTQVEEAGQDEAHDADEDEQQAVHDGLAVELDRDALRAWRRSRGMSQEQLAAAIRRAGDEIGIPNKCNKRLVQKWESGEHRTVRPDYLRTLLHVTRLKTANLIVVGADPRPPGGKALQCATVIHDLTRMGAHCTATSTALQVEWAALLVALGDLHRQWAQQAAAPTIPNAEPASDVHDA